MVYLDIRESGGSIDSYMYFRNSSDKGLGIPHIDEDEIVLTQSPVVFELYKEKGYSVQYLSSYLAINTGVGLFEVFSFFFEGKVIEDLDMTEAIFNGLIFDSNWCFCLKIGVTFCWFRLEEKRLVKLGVMQFSEIISKYTVGKFMKRLRYNMAKSGVNLSKVKFLTWSSEDLDYEFSNYILSHDCLVDFFNRIDGLKNLTTEAVMRLLSKDILFRYTVTAENFVNCLNEAFDALGLREIDGVLFSSNVFYKDYSMCISSIVDMSKCDFGIILDCEGKSGSDGSLSNGCGELGGIIFCKYKNILLNLDTFSCDEFLIEETLIQASKVYRDFSPSWYKNINIVVFGNSDVTMLDSTLSNAKNRKLSKNIRSQVKYINCQSFVLNYCLKNNILIEGKQTLSNIARALGVLPVFPKHKAINDARTLFNILAKILHISDYFVM